MIVNGARDDSGGSALSFGGSSLRDTQAGLRSLLRLLLMDADGVVPWSDLSRLRDVQYRTEANLAARQSIYAYQHPQVSLPAASLDLAALRGDETVADVGCGNGAYLAELGRRGHRGPVLGVDFSVGMLAAARRRAPAAGLVAGDAAALPLRDEAADVALAMHMLYHVPDPSAGVRELRRVTRDGGQVLVVLNDDDHLRELRQEVTAALRDSFGIDRQVPFERLRIEEGAELLAAEFRRVRRVDFIGELRVPARCPIEDYVRSTLVAQELPDPGELATAVTSRIAWDGEPFRIRTHCGCLVCT